MGRHADPDAGAFWRSLGASATRAMVVLGVGAIVALAILQATGDDPVGSDVALESGAEPARLEPATGPAPTDVPVPPDPSRAAPDAGPAAPEADPTTAPAPAPAAAPTAAPAPEPQTDSADVDPDAEPAVAAPVAAAPPPQETTVQVLDGVGGDGRQARAAADLLRGLGYDVVVVNPAGLDYATTEVQFSSGNDAAAAALAGQDARFAAVGPNRNLADDIDLHVIVGSDFTG